MLRQIQSVQLNLESLLSYSNLYLFAIWQAFHEILQHICKTYNFSRSVRLSLDYLNNYNGTRLVSQFINMPIII